MPVILATQEAEQEDHEFKASLGKGIGEILSQKQNKLGASGSCL
jgi:hypothetical protein